VGVGDVEELGRDGRGSIPRDGDDPALSQGRVWAIPLSALALILSSPTAAAYQIPVEDGFRDVITLHYNGHVGLRSYLHRGDVPAFEVKVVEGPA
jgi:hypothetical protein